VKRILSGIQPTGLLHLGNIIGAVENWTRLQHEYEAFISIVDWHALTTTYADGIDLRGESERMAVELLSVGIDPEKACLFVQSDVPEHTELHLLFSMFTTIARLERVPTFKEKVEQLSHKEINTYGFFGYPVLQAADILIYRATHVPVGEDQLPHIELTREIARKYNNIFGEYFPEPDPLLAKATRLLGLDNRKMSKSYGNTINLSETEEETTKKIGQMITDPARVRRNDPGNPDICNVFSYHKVFNTDDRIDYINKACRTAEIGCRECKMEMAGKVNEYLRPYRERYKEYSADPERVRNILAKGAERAREVAGQTMHDVKKTIKMVR
jgi:tryptophanyl-tRNA synthetase